MQRSRWAAVLVCLALPALTRAQDLRPGADYRIDSAKSEIAWEVDASLHTVRSRTRELSGRVKVVSSGDDGVSLEGRLEIDAGSFETGNGRRDRVLRELSHKSSEERHTACEQASILQSLDNLLTYPWLKRRVEQCKLVLHGWYFDIDSGALMAYSARQQQFLPIVCPVTHAHSPHSAAA